MKVSTVIFLIIGGLTTLVHSTDVYNVAATTPSPSPMPQLDHTGETNVFNVTNGDGKICILFKALIQFNVTYKNVNDSNKTSVGTFYLPSEAKGTKVSGSCNESASHQTMNLTFFDNWTLSLSFINNGSINKYFLEHFKLTYKLQNGSLPFPDAEATDKRVAEMRVLDDSIPDLSSYVCLSQRTLLPQEQVEVGFQKMLLANEQYQAFVSLDEAFFSTTGVRCTDDKISNLVPIAVGAALAVLIVIVLVAYLIGRHKSRKGYESV